DLSQFVRFVRLDSKVDGAEPSRLGDVSLLIRGGQNYYGQFLFRRLGAQPVQDIKSIHERHFEVQEHHGRKRELLSVCIGACSAKIINRLLAVLRNDEGASDAGAFTSALQEEDVIGVILGN